MTIEATILDVSPETTYQETVFENRVLIEYGGVQFGVFDPNLLASSDLVGRECVVTVVPFLVSRIDVPEDTANGVIPNAEDPDGWNYHTYVGTITEITETDPRTVTLDLEPGTVAVELDVDESRDDFVKALQVGDDVSVTTIRTDLHGIEPM